MRRVLVTRPEPDASRTAGRLAALGFDAVTLPLSRTVALAAGPSDIPPGTVAVAVTSANALRHARPEMIEALLGMRCFAVGERTTAVAREAGFRDVIPGGGDAESLAVAIGAAAPAGPVVYLCGRVRRPEFERLLSAAGIDLRAVETYDTIILADEAEAALRHPEMRDFDFALVYSANAAAALAQLARKPGIADLFARTEFLCLSERIGASLRGAARAKIAVASEPTDMALLSLLPRRGPHSP